MAFGRRRGFDAQQILTIGDTVPKSVGGILLAMVVVTVATMISRPLWGLLCLDPELIPAGQVWRLVTWVFPAGDPLTLLFSGFVLHWLGRDLANSWSERKFLQVFFGYAAWAAACTTLVAAIWGGANRLTVGAWPVVNALLVGWAFARPGAQNERALRAAVVDRGRRTGSGEEQRECEAQALHRITASLRRNSL